MSDETSRKSLEDAVEAYLNNGGEVTKLRYAAEKDLNKSRRKHFHDDKALAGNENSKEFLEKDAAKEKTLIFSKTDRWRKS